MGTESRPGGRTSRGSRFKQVATKSLKSFENSAPSRVGGGFLGIRNSTLERSSSAIRQELLERKDADLHGVKLGVRWLALGELDCGNTQTPYICLVVIAGLLDDFGRHPIRCSDEGVLLGGQRSRQLSRDSEVGKLDGSISTEKDVRSCSEKLGALV